MNQIVTYEDVEVSIRAELLPSKVSKKRVTEVSNLLKAIQKANDNNQDSSKHLEKYNEITNQNVPLEEVLNIESFSDYKDFAEMVLTDLPEVGPVEKNELIDVLKLHDSDAFKKEYGWDATTEYVTSFLAEKTGDEYFSDIIFFPNLYFGFEGYEMDEDKWEYVSSILTPEMLIEVALAKGEEKENLKTELREKIINYIAK